MNRHADGFADIEAGPAHPGLLHGRVQVGRLHAAVRASGGSVRPMCRQRWDEVGGVLRRTAVPCPRARSEEGQDEHEARAPGRRRASQLTTVCPRDLLDDPQSVTARTAPAPAPAPPAAPASEAGEGLRQPRSLVPNFDPDLRPARPSRNRDDACAVLDGVGEEISNSLSEANAVPADRHPTRTRDIEPHRAPGCSGGRLARTPAQKTRHIDQRHARDRRLDGLASRGPGSTPQARHAVGVTHRLQVPERDRRPTNRQLESLQLLGRERTATASGFEPQGERGERPAQLVQRSGKSPPTPSPVELPSREEPEAGEPPGECEHPGRRHLSVGSSSR